MPTYVNIPDTSLAPTQPLTQQLLTALRNNPLAIAAASPGAPHLAPSRALAFLTPGVHTWIIPTGVYRIRVLLVGGGGSGGANGDSIGGDFHGGAGGGSGAHFMSTFVVEPGQSYRAEVAAGGAAVSSGTHGNNGGATSFYLTAFSTEVITVNGGHGGNSRCPGGAGGTVPGIGPLTNLQPIGAAISSKGGSGSRGFGKISLVESSGGKGGDSIIGSGGAEGVFGFAGSPGVLGGGGSGNGSLGNSSGAGGNGAAIIWY